MDIKCYDAIADVKYYTDVLEYDSGECYDIDDIAEVDDELHIRYYIPGMQSGSSVRVSNVNFACGPEPCEPFIRLFKIIDGNSLKDMTSNEPPDLGWVSLELTEGGALEAHTDIFGKWCIFPVQARQLLFGVSIDDMYKFYEYPWKNNAWKKIKEQFMMVGRYLDGVMVRDARWSVQMLYLKVWNAQQEWSWQLF